LFDFLLYFLILSMTQNTKIEWADHTFNPWWGCTKISPACDNCYAAALDKRTGGDHWGANQPRKRTSAKNWLQPVKWNKQAEAFFAEHGRRQRVFCASMADVFDNTVDPQWRADLFSLIATTPNLDWLLLTKRIGNVTSMVPAEFLAGSPSEGIPANVWLGATICNQEEADRDIPKLLAVPAAKRFLSVEPMLGAIDLTAILHATGYGASPCTGCGEVVTRNTLDGSTACLQACDGPTLAALDWVIVGGESGPGARPMHPDWARSLRNQCAAASVPFLFKQWGEYQSVFHNDHDDECQRTPKAVHISGKIEYRPIEASACMHNSLEGWTAMCKVGKKSAGRELDGMEHNGAPT
jgi:protein gp37